MYILTTLLLVVLDQVTKAYAIANFKGQEMVELIDNWLYLTYLENKGAAFGMLSDKPWLFTIIASLFVIAILFIIFKNRNNFDRFYKFTLAIIVAGALGNLIDRFRYGFVVDFIFSPLGGLYDFPVFNFADMYLSVAAFVLAIYIFIKEDKDETNL